MPRDLYHRKTGGSLVFEATMQSSITPGKGDSPTFARGSVAYEDTYSGGTVTLSEVASGTARICTRQDGSANVLTGYLAEEARTDHVVQSEDFSLSWTRRGTATVVVNQEVAPDGETTADKISVSTSGNDIFATFSTPGTAGAPYAPSVWIKRITATGTLLLDNPSGVGSWQVNFGLLGSGWNYITKTHPAVTVAVPLVQTGAGNGGIWFKTGGATLEFYAWGSQCEDNSVETSYIKTVTAVATRVADDLEYPAPIEDPTEMTVHCEVLGNNEDDTGGTLWEMSDGGSSADRIWVTVEPTTGYARVRSTATAGSGGDVTGSTDVFDGDAHQVMICIKDGSLLLLVDGVEEGTPDTSVTMPDDLDTFAVGNDASGNQINGLIANLLVYRKFLPGKAITPSWS